MTYLRIIAIFLLLFNGMGAIFGGWSLITDPTGEDIQLPLIYLEHSPFHNFLIPGIILFTVNGIFSIVAIVWTIFQWRHYNWLIVAQGILLGGWIVVQMILLRHFYYLQFVFGGIGLVLLMIGYLLRKMTKTKPQK
jgi:hypothetical protein